MQQNVTKVVKKIIGQKLNKNTPIQFFAAQSIQFKHGHNRGKSNQEQDQEQTFNTPQELENFVYSNKNTTKMTVRDAIRHAIAGELERDPTTFLMGEEVARYDGAYKVSKKLSVEFSEDRVIDTPITEAGFTGLGVGAGLAGCKPIIEFMTFNFAMQSIDHIVNSAAKAKYMSGGDLDCPIVFRGLNGASGAVGAQHSQCFAAWYASVPGLITLTPYDAADAIGLFRSAVRNPNPVVFLENEIMYNAEFEVPEAVLDPSFTMPIGKARIMREGTDVTLVSFARMVQVSLQAADQLAQQGISCEVININSMKPLDRESIINSVKKTNRIVCVEEGWSQHGIGAEVAGILMESTAFDYLDAPMERLCGADIPMPYAFNLEEAAKPQVQNVINAVQKTLVGHI